MAGRGFGLIPNAVSLEIGDKFLVQQGVTSKQVDFEVLNQELEHGKFADRNAAGAHDTIYRRAATVSQVENGDFEIDAKLSLIDRADAPFNVKPIGAHVVNGFDILNAGVGKVAVLVKTDVLLNLDHLGLTQDEDNSQLFQFAINKYKKITSDKNFSLNGIIVPTHSVVELYGEIKKVGVTTYTAQDGLTYNPMFIIGNQINNVEFKGQPRFLDGDFNEITHSSSAECFLFDFCFNVRFSDFQIRKFKWDFRQTKLDFFGVSWTDGITISCENSFVFGEDGFKTTLKLERIYVQNAGKTYYFKNARYSSIDVCAADYCNYVRPDNPYDGTGFGSKSAVLGVYSFENSHSITVNSIGCEQCYANGILRINSSTVTVNGATVENLMSEHVPTNAAEFVGVVTSGAEAGQSAGVRITGLYINGYTNSLIASNRIATIAYNHSNGAYGNPNRYVWQVDINKTTTGRAAVGGSGDVSNVRLTQDSTKNLDQVYLKRFDPIKLTGSLGTIITIPFTSNSAANTQGLLTIKTINSTPNSTFARGGEALVDITHLTTLTSGTASISVAGNISSVTKSGLNLIINLTNACPTCVLHAEMLSGTGANNFINLASATIN